MRIILLLMLAARRHTGLAAKSFRQNLSLFAPHRYELFFRIRMIAAPDACRAARKLASRLPFLSLRSTPLESCARSKRVGRACCSGLARMFGLALV